MIRLAFLLRDLAKGGAEKIASDLIFHLPDSIDKHLFLYQKNIDYPYTGKLTDLGLTEAHGFAGKAGKLLRRRTAIRTAKRAHAVTHTMSLLNGPNVMNVLSRVQDQIVLCAHNTASAKYSGLSPHALANRLAIRLFYPRADAIVAVSEGIKQDLSDNFGLDPGLITVIHNPYDTKKIQAFALEAVDTYEPLFHRPVLANTGRLTQAKGQSRLLRIFREVKRHVPEAALMIFGDGELRDQIVRLAENLNLKVFNAQRQTSVDTNADVYFMGFVSNPFRFIARSTLFVFPSLWEGFPNALAEAMICGLPCLASDCPSGPRELLAPGTSLKLKADKPLSTEYGILMPVPDGHDFTAAPPDPVEITWAASIIDLLNRKERRDVLGKAAQNRASMFDVDNIVPRYVDLLQNCSSAL